VNTSILKAKRLVRDRSIAKAKKQVADKDLKALIQGLIVIPSVKDGARGVDGKDAPSMADILTQVKPLLPETKIEQTTIIQKMEEGDFSGMFDAMLEAKMPELERKFRPKVELIRDEKPDLTGFATKKELDKALQRVQEAITYHSSSGGASVSSVSEILLAQLSEQNMDTLIDTAGAFTYIGKATPGTAKATALWQIKRVEDLGGGDNDIRFADGTADFTKIWDDRATYAY